MAKEALYLSYSLYVYLAELTETPTLYKNHSFYFDKVIFLKGPTFVNMKSRKKCWPYNTVNRNDDIARLHSSYIYLRINHESIK